MAAQTISQSATTQQPRLMIKEIVLHNFKSYAGEQRVGPFHKDGEGFDVVPGSELVIARTAHSNNSSNYYVNGRKSSFSDVTALLKAKGVDLDNNRFLILQGEVEQISMMKPKAQQPNETGLLEYLEDIIGTDQYVEPIEEHYKRLEEVSEARQGMVARVKVVERERDALEDDKLLAESYLSKQRAMHACKATTAQLQMRAGEENIATIDKSMAKLTDKLQYEQNKAQEANTALEEAEAAFNAITEQHSALVKELQAAAKEVKGFDNKDTELRVLMKAKKEEIAKLQAKAAAADTKRTETEAELEKLHKDIPRIERRMTDMAAALQEAEQDVACLTEGCKEETERLVTALQGVRSKLAPWEARAADVQSKLDVAAAERGALVKEHEAAKAQLKAAQDALAAAEQAAVDKAADIKSMDKELKSTRKAMEAAAADQEAAEEVLKTLEAGVGELRGRVEQRRADRSSAANQGRVVAGLMEAKRKGTLKGIHGRLGDLGAVDAKYDVAASTAIAALDYIVVDSTADAQTAVEHLRRNSLGVATFLILDKQQHLATAASKTASPPEGVPRLFDLVRCDNTRLRVAFYYAMRDTVVADDLDQAARIAYGGDGRWKRVVTLKGEMINESGTMTGGGGKPRGGRIRLGKAGPKAADGAELEAALAADEQSLAQHMEALADARARCKQATATARDASRSIASLETQIAKAQLAVEAAQATADDLNTRLDGLKAQTRMDAADAARLKELEAEVAALHKELDSIEKGAAGLRTEAAGLQEGIDNAGGQALREARARVASIEQGTVDAEADVQRKRVAIKTANKALTKLDKDAAKARAEEEELTAKLQEDLRHQDEMLDAAAQVTIGMKVTEAKLVELREEVEAVRATHEAKMTEASVIRKVEATITEELSKLKASRDKEGAAMKHAERQLSEELAKLQDAGAQDPASLLLQPEQLAAIKNLDAEIKEYAYQTTILEEQLGKMNVNLGTIEAYRAKEAEYLGRMKELEAATAQRDEVKQAYEALRKRRLDEFMAGFHVISLKLKEMYQMITLGGDAELELVDSLDPFTEGIVFSVRPPKKSWKNISNLSGGEKTLSSLSLVFALHHYKPTPLYFMDEIDAALDFKNVSIVAHYIVEKTQGAQFIVISLRNNMFELADRLVGIYKTDNCTKSVAINPRSFVVGPLTQEGPARAVGNENRPHNAITA